MEFVVNGAGGTSGGVVGCSYRRGHKTYHHKMSYLNAQPKDERMDFVVRRADGTGVRLHPQKTKRTIDAYDEHPHPQPVSAPRRGVGRSDGRGTFKRYKELGVTRILRFKEAQVSR